MWRRERERMSVAERERKNECEGERERMSVEERKRKNECGGEREKE